MLARENEEPWMFFCLVSTQLRSAGMGGVIGIDYRCIDLMFDYHDVPHWRRRDLMDDIRLIEVVALKSWNSDKGRPQRPDQAKTDPRRRVR